MTHPIYDIHEKKIQDSFAGQGVETIIAKGGVIQAHIRAWGNPEVIDEAWRGHLEGQPVRARGHLWLPLKDFDLENAQGWASEVMKVEAAKLTIGLAGKK